MIGIGDRVRVQPDGEPSAATRKYAGRKGTVATISVGSAGITFFVRIEGSVAETSFEERELVKVE